MLTSLAVPFEELSSRRQEALRRRRVILDAVEVAARNRAPCPSHKELRELTGYTQSGLSTVLAELREGGLLELRGVAPHTIARLPHLDIETADPDIKGNYVPVREIIILAAEIWGVRTADIYGPCRKIAFVRPRQSTCFVARGFGWSLPHIGRAMGLEHSTVSHAVDQIGYLVQRDELLRARVNELRRRATPERLAA